MAKDSLSLRANVGDSRPSPAVSVPAAQAIEAEGREPWPPPRQAWYAVFIFALSLLVNFLDRGILTLLVEPIKRDLGLSDVEMSLVMGFAFVCFYVLLGLPIARLVDSRSRRAIIGVGITIWSFMTAFCGLAHSFVQLFACRVGVGVGEACTGPATYSMLADLFSKEKLPRAIALLNFGFYAGNGLAFMIGGTIAGLFLTMPPLALPIVGALHGWQLTFFIVGLPGLIVALLMRTVREPKRRGLLGRGSSQQTNTPKLLSIREVLGFLGAHSSTYVPLFLGMGIQVTMLFGLGSWGPAFYIRTFHWTPAKFGLVQGVLFLTVMPLGAYVGGLLAEGFAKKGYDDANLRVVVWASLLSLPGFLAYPLMPRASLAIAVSAAGLFVSAWIAGPINAALQTITPNQMRGQITALFLFVFNVIGFGLGPTFVALFTDHVFHAESKIGLSLAATVAVLGPVGAFVLWLGMKPYARSVAQARTWT